MKLFRKALWLAAVSGLAGIVMLAGSPKTGETQEALKQISIISTASVNGELSPCG